MAQLKNILMFLSASFLCLVFLASCGDDDPAIAAPLTINIEDGAYIPSNGKALKSCTEYLSYDKGDALYWLDPDGENVGVDVFKVECDMSLGGFAVIASVSTPAFPVTNTTDTNFMLFTNSEIAQINALRSIATEIDVESDLEIEFNSDTASGGCGGTPTIASGDMTATTLPLSTGTNTTATVRIFASSADHMSIEFDKTQNTFVKTAASSSCADTLVANFGVDEAVIIKELTLKTDAGSPTRAYSRVSGTYYRVLIK